MIDRMTTWSLTRPTAAQATTVAAWSRSAEEAGQWCSVPEHPFDPARLGGWWETADVEPWLLLDPDGAPAAYGEVWDDAEEDETELARLIVDPDRRRTGVGRRLVDHLVDRAERLGRAACFVRVAPGNDGALSVYRAAGFVDVDEATAAEWNHGQPVAYRWLAYGRPTDPSGTDSVVGDQNSGSSTEVPTGPAPLASWS